MARQLGRTNDQLARSSSEWEMCRRIAREHGKSFYAASYCLPAERRRAILAVYAFCRIADDLVDRAIDVDTALLAIEAWEGEIDHPASPVAIAFARARRRFGVSEQAARGLLAGVRMDLLPCRYESWAALHHYCYAVAGTVGLMVAPLLGCQDERALPYAVDLGVAMQLTNILRDIDEDARQGRLYLPVDELLSFGIDPESVLAGNPNGAFRDFMAFQIARARGLYASAAMGLPALDRSGRLTTLAAMRFYSAILKEIEKLDYDVFGVRAHLTTGQKLLALPSVLVGFAQLPRVSA